MLTRFYFSEKTSSWEADDVQRLGVGSGRTGIEVQLQDKINRTKHSAQPYRQGVQPAGADYDCRAMQEVERSLHLGRSIRASRLQTLQAHSHR